MSKQTRPQSSISEERREGEKKKNKSINHFGFQFCGRSNRSPDTCVVIGKKINTHKHIYKKDTITTNMLKSQKKSRCKDNMILTIKIFLGLAVLAGIGAVVLTSRRNMQQTLFKDEKQITTNTLNNVVVVPPQANRNKKSFTYQGLGGPWQSIRLPTDIVPQHYDLDLNVDMDKETYIGVVNILVNVTGDSVRYILLHKVNISITQMTINDINGHKLNVLQTFENTLYEYLVIEMSYPLIKGTQLKIGLNFQASLRTDLTGFFITRKGNSKMAATFLSPVSTRKFFPCFDEPVFKATFSIKVTHSSQYKALSNMPVTTQTTVKSQTKTEFKKSLPMSTYNLGLLLADDTYQVKEKRIVGSLTIQIWDFKTNSGWKSETDDIVKLLDYYERHFFQVPFPLEKLDVAVIPDYIPGAMETWGLMMFRVGLDKYHLVAHEIAHQWFGNLVTMEFWDVAWIKEGFAQYLATVVGDTVRQTQRYKNQFFSGMSRALPMDSYATSHPIVPEINTPTDIRNVYDNIVYYKGEPVVHILATLVGMTNFRKGMKRFLQQYKYKNAEQDDLFRVFGDISGIDVKSFMDPWLLQMGYPLLSVNRLNNTHIEVEQERFSMDAPNTALKASPFNYQWPIIVTYRDLNDVKSKQVIMTGKKAILPIPDGSVLNPDHMQYYRIRFSKNSTAQLKKQLIHNQSRFTVNDRIGIISDMFFNLQARKMKLEQVIDFLEYFKHEREHSTWTEGIKILTKVHDLIKHDDSLRNLWDKKIIQPYVERAYSLFQSKGAVIRDACYLNHTQAIQDAE
eukprot:TCONS_00020985-protein